MLLLILGLIVFLGAHSTRIVADGWRTWQIERLGEQRWKALYGLVSLIGFALIVWGYGAARSDPLVLWQAPGWSRHLAGLLMLPAFVLLVAAYVPGNRIKLAVGHPMLLGTEIWAVAHLLANGSLADVLLFGSFLVWAIADHSAARARDRASAKPMAPAADAWLRDALTVGIGVAAWNFFAWLAHRWLFGVAPFG